MNGKVEPADAAAASCRFTFDAFLSYSHAADAELAPVLQSALHRLARPWYRLRALRVFRDKTSLAANPALWPSIEAALSASGHFILLASPQSAASPWVEREITWWLTHRSVETLSMAVTAGEIVWDAGARDWDWSRTTSLARGLAHRFADEPLYVDLRWARGARALSLRQTAFRSAVLDLAVPLHGKLKDDLDGDDVRRHRHTMRLAFSAIVVLAVLLVAAIVSAVFAMRQRDLAEERSRISLSRQLSAQSIERQDEQLDLALLLAVEAHRTCDTFEARRSLLAAATRQPQLLAFLKGPSTQVGLDYGDVFADEVTDVAFSPDGAHVASLHVGGAFRVWDPGTFGRVDESLQRPPDVRSVALSPDFALVALQHEESLEIRERVTGRSLSVASEAFGDNCCLAFSPDGRVLATESDQGLSLWDVATGQRIGLPLTAPDSGLPLLLIFSPDGAWLVSETSAGGMDLHLWDVATHRERVASLTHGNVRSVAFAAENRTMVGVVSDGSVHAWDLTKELNDGKEISGRDSGPAGARSVAITPDGTVVAIGREDGSIDRQHVGWQEQVGDTLRAHVGAVTALAFGANGSLLVSGGEDGTVALWDMSRAHVMADQLPGVPRGAGFVTFSPDGLILAGCTMEGGQMWAVRTRSPFGPPLAPERSSAASVAFSPDGTSIATGLFSEKAQLWSVPDGSPAGRPFGDSAESNHSRGHGSVAFSADGRTVATCTWDADIILWDASSRREQARLPHESDPDSDSDLESESSEVVQLVFSPDATLLAVGGKSVPGLWDLSRKRPAEPPLEGNTNASRRIAMSRDGRMLAGSTDRGILLWDLATRRRLGELIESVAAEGDEDRMCAMAFSPDGQRLATVSGDDGVVLWEVALRRKLGVLVPAKIGHGGDLQGGVAFSPDGRFLAVCYDDAFALWDVDPSSWRERALRIANRQLTADERTRYLGDHMSGSSGDASRLPSEGAR